MALAKIKGPRVGSGFYEDSLELSCGKKAVEKTAQFFAEVNAIRQTRPLRILWVVSPCTGIRQRELTLQPQVENPSPESEHLFGGEVIAP
jgi:hypothetical protein